MAHVAHLRVVGDDGVVVERHHEPLVVLEVLLDVVEKVVLVKRVPLGRHLHVRARELAAGAVVVDHEVVRPEHAGIAHDLVADVLDVGRVGDLAQKRAHGLPDELHAAPEDESAHGQARPAVEVDVDELRDDGGREDRRRGDDIVSRVHGRGLEGLRGDGAPEAPVERRHPELDRHRAHEHDDHGRPELGGLGAHDLLDGGADQVDADGAYQDGDDEARQVLVAAMAVGVVLVRGPARELEAEQAHHVARGVGEVVDRVGDDGDRAGHEPDGALPHAEQDVADDAGDARHEPVARAHRGVPRVIRVGDKRPYQPARHANLPLPSCSAREKYTHIQRMRAALSRGILTSWSRARRAARRTRLQTTPVARRAASP